MCVFTSWCIIMVQITIVKVGAHIAIARVIQSVETIY
jgi:hypothetical protein